MVEQEKLSDPQQEIINLCSDKNYVIQGGAGTGKTVIALYRAKKMSEEGKKTIILVHNKPLQNYIENEITKLKITNCKARTYDSWLYRIYITNGKKVPAVDDNSFNYNFEQIVKDIEEDAISIPEDTLGNILIDESQDFSPLLLSFIKKVTEKSGFTVTCLIDANQCIQNTETTLKNALKEIDVESARTLDTNYRSTKQSASIAKLFWSQKGVYPKSLKDGQKPTLISCETDEEKIRKIAEIATRYNFKSDIENVQIGIFVNNANEGGAIYKALCEELGKKYIQYRLSKEDDKKKDDDLTKINFAKSGIKIFTYSTIKGLDFDAIVIGDNIKNEDDDVYKNTLYMTLTRATSDIYICYKKNENPSDDNYFIKTLKENKDLCNWQ